MRISQEVDGCLLAPHHRGMSNVAVHLCCLLLVVLLAGCQMSPGMPRNWSAFRGGPLHQGSAGGAREIGKPQQVWEFDTGGTVESSPTVVEGTV